MNKTIILIILTLSIAASARNGFAQEFEFIDTDTRNYPEIKARYFLKNHDGSIIRNIGPENLELIDNGIKREVKFNYCTPLSKFSSILTIDISYSMRKPIDSTDFWGPKRIDLARAGAKIWIDSVPMERAECAITSFNFDAWVNQDFTIDRSRLKIAIDSAIKDPQYGTNYNGAFLIDKKGNPGALELAKTAQFKPIVIFLTDGAHDAGYYGPVKTQAIIDEAKNLNATVYCITLGMPMPAELKEISLKTGGAYYANIIDEESATGAYLDILEKVTAIGTPIPCEMLWDTDCGGGNADLYFKDYGIKGAINYAIPAPDRPFLNISPAKVNFVNGTFNGQETALIKLKALNKPVTIDTAYLNSGIVEISGGPEFPISLSAGKSADLLVKYRNGSDTAYKEFGLIVEGDFCSRSEIKISSGFFFPISISAGVADTNNPKFIKIEKAFRNISGGPILIEKIEISGKHGDEFVVSGPNIILPLPHNSYLPAEILFSPRDIGLREANIIYKVNGSEYKAGLWGIGAGQPALAAPGSVNLGSAACPGEAIISEIEFMNSGVEDLQIDYIYFEKGDYFDFTEEMKFPIILEMGEKKNAKIRFFPAKAGDYKDNLIFRSNSYESSTHTIPVLARQDSIGFDLSGENLYLGAFCADGEKTASILVRNTGDKDLEMAMESSSLELQGKIVIPPGAERSLPIKISTNEKGSFSENIFIKSERCEIGQKLTAQWDIYSPGFNLAEMFIVSKPGFAVDTSINLINESPEPVYIAEAYFEPGPFSVTGSQIPASILPGDSLKVGIRYHPEQEKIVKSNLIISGPTCNFIQKTPFTGNPSLPMAEIAIESISAHAGQVIEIQPLFRNSHKFKQTLTSEISFDIELLKEDFQPLATTGDKYSISELPDKYILEFKGISVNPEGNNQVLAMFKAKALNSGKPAADIRISNARSNGADVFYLLKHGRAEIIYSSAEILIPKNLKAAPGEILQIPIIIDNIKNASEFHKSISITLSFNPTLLSPTGATPEGKFSKEARIIQFTDIPIPNGHGQFTLAAPEFIATLGNSPGTEIEIIQAETALGIVDFNIKNGHFELDIDDTTRLFSPFHSLNFLQPYPNPATGATEIRMELAETGRYVLILRASSGGAAAILYSGNLEQGHYSVFFNASKYSAGMYFLELRTPSNQPLIERINIIR